MASWTASIARSSSLCLVLVACGGGDDPPGDRDACNPLGVEDQCMMPWPSMAYATADTATATGWRLDLPVEAMPENIDRVPVDPAPFNRWDGFSTMGPILARFPGGVSAAGLPPHTDPARSLAADSPILLLELATPPVRVPFFAEVDMNVNDPAERTLIIRPLVRLDPSSRYGVAILDTVQSASGGALPVAPGFAAVRDGGRLDHDRWDQTTAGFDALFAAIEAEGVPRSRVVLAWDFVTASNEWLRHDMTEMVTQGKAMIGDAGANLSFTAEMQTPGISYRRYTGTYDSPNFLSNGEADTSVMLRDADGTPRAMGMRDARFAAIVPSCVANLPLPRPTILFGHGLFGSAEDYLNDGLVLDLAEDFCFVIVAGDFIGLTERQLALAPLAANDVNKAFWISDKLQQAIVDFIALENAIRGPMRTAPEFLYMGQEVIDPTRLYYLGGSLGGIMGNTFMAYDETIRKAVLAVPGGNWSMLFERSSAWTLLQGAAQGSYPDLGLGQMLIALMGMTLEPVDPLTTAELVRIDPPAANPRQVLLWEAIGDSLVTNIATELVARTMQLPVTGPSVKEVWGLETSTAQVPSGFTIVDEHATPLPSMFNVPEDDNGTHSDCNRRGALLREAEAFLLNDSIRHPCQTGGSPAPCDCATGACD
jgi:hypothetical protein